MNVLQTLKRNILRFINFISQIYCDAEAHSGRGIHVLVLNQVSSCPYILELDKKNSG